MENNHNSLKNIAEYYYHTFETPHGKKALEHLEGLVDISVLASNPMIDIQADVNPSDFVFMREGHNQVVRYIKTMIKYYKENRNG